LDEDISMAIDRTEVAERVIAAALTNLHFL
jgi:hypothetical protein